MAGGNVGIEVGGLATFSMVGATVVLVSCPDAVKADENSSNNTSIIFLGCLKNSRDLIDGKKDSLSCRNSPVWVSDRTRWFGTFRFRSCFKPDGKIHVPSLSSSLFSLKTTGCKPSEVSLHIDMILMQQWQKKQTRLLSLAKQTRMPRWRMGPQGRSALLHAIPQHTRGNSKNLG